MSEHNDASQYNIMFIHVQVHTLKHRAVPFQSNAHLGVKSDHQTSEINDKRNTEGCIADLHGHYKWELE